MGISSVAFPLLGAGDNGFSTQKALDIALNRFEVSIRDEISELTVYLVLFHQEDLLYAKKLAGEKHLAINDCEVDDMLPENKRWISLISTCMIAYRAERVMLSASNLQFKSCLKKPESYLPIVLATVLAINV